MRILFNEKVLNFDNSLTIADLLNSQNFKYSCFAVMLNNSFIAKGSYSEIFLKNNDVVITVQPMQGG
ncbi:thiamine biosynthesis protein ThiS [Francisella tularensis subsp. novicida]|uniref:sulfur carrier protein ThiS n=1 Tax=Francisella tularensis TaxID=263 RepID=UPI000CE299DE|nr:sulfur carrier protein ThiS [Francisella tularensis]AVC44045.1 thiamine biosynthesis protein ThiS [Francisella tularensis subsp. novicida]